MDKKITGPVTMMSCVHCKYHDAYTDPENHSRSRTCMKKIVETVIPCLHTSYTTVEGHYSYTSTYPASIDLPGNETPDWCPLLPNEEKQ